MESKDQLRKQLRTQRNERLACADFTASDIPASDIPASDIQARNFPASHSATGHSEAGRCEPRESSSWTMPPRKNSAASDSDLAIIQQLDALLPELLKKRPGSIASFWPLAGEPDLRPLASKGLPLALPRTEPSGLCFLPWHADTVLEPDSCGIPSPRRQRPLAAEELSVLLVPALAVDQRGIRLGSGGGWYDRLRADPGWGAVPALVVLPQAFVKAQLPRDPWDIPFHGWITEQGLRWVQ
jgi:5-formyltetrahydrofolate cyclo-ligase